MSYSNSNVHAVAVIPARGGSKGVPGKNILPLAGKPLIAYSIEAALHANTVQDVYVSTDDARIASVARDYGAKIIERPSELAGDTATSESALRHALFYLELLGICPDYFVFLQCTSPLRSSDDIDCAMYEMLSNDADSLLSVCPSHRFLWELCDGVPVSINYDWRSRPRRQDMRPQYIENGSIYIYKPWVLRENENRLGGNIVLYVMDENKSYEIDSLDDFRYLEWVVQNAKFQ
ncbi:cytidylyltransferase domain-containing protein [Candidatus Symbiobacter mobilis]|uniref:N-acylneuraminate cytidylyltransferase n=1 Tax=Candidatus Symbiobacter mobilis CR TaxID=946483 RepID=U5N7H6_9BURK|nr:acylneuraminate cytidylyltransferase family protein [Candidatus Symbiobacter mobilis]AGX86149.1 N-acylneuraminate cytidylyltransferase [Candidatus Symbiobacter mobilis CR]